MELTVRLVASEACKTSLPPRKCKCEGPPSGGPSHFGRPELLVAGDDQRLHLLGRTRRDVGGHAGDALVRARLLRRSVVRDRRRSACDRVAENRTPLRVVRRSGREVLAT